MTHEDSPLLLAMASAPVQIFLLTSLQDGDLSPLQRQQFVRLSQDAHFRELFAPLQQLGCSAALWLHQEYLHPDGPFHRLQLIRQQLEAGLSPAHCLLFKQQLLAFGETLIRLGHLPAEQQDCLMLHTGDIMLDGLHQMLFDQPEPAD
ncbi:hypothetical protein ACFOSS_14985 [Pseudaeromonas sharmana]|uniref:Uncharacterized protein n=1 Tax=Pseudaeromonas sharmana TaxID=328412 RepID=A0ABV8CRG2_9GAMM